MINIEDNSIIKSVYNQYRIEVISIHRYGYKEELNIFKIVAKADDGVIEGVEYKKVVVVQFHPEFKYGDKIFDYLIEEASK